MSDKLSLDDMIHIEINNCYFCGVELNENNKSMWSPFAKVNGEIVIVDQCKQCDENNSPIGKEISKKPKLAITNCVIASSALK